MTDTVYSHRFSVTSTSGQQQQQAKDASMKQLGQATHDAIPQQQQQATDTRSINLELLRDQLRAAKIPMTKRGSITEVPQPAADCNFYPGTQRCRIELCPDECTQLHAHHRTHAQPPKSNGTLVYSRPSLSMLPGSGAVSNFQSPAGSPPTSLPVSQTNSPQQQYRRASQFGFNFHGSQRGSIMSTGFGAAMSSPPSPMAGDASGPSSAMSSAPTSPRSTNQQPQQLQHTIQSDLAADLAKPIAEEPTPLLSALPENVPPKAAAVLGLPTEYWKIQNHIVNLNDYRPGVVGIGTTEALTRRDLAPAPRDDCPNQASAAWDPRSPRPPSPVELDECEVISVNMNQEDRTQPEIEYEIRPAAVSSGTA